MRYAEQTLCIWVILNMSVCSPQLGTRQASDLAKDGAFIVVVALREVAQVPRGMMESSHRTIGYNKRIYQI